MDPQAEERNTTGGTGHSANLLIPWWIWLEHEDSAEYLARVIDQGKAESRYVR